LFYYKLVIDVRHSTLKKLCGKPLRWLGSLPSGKDRTVIGCDGGFLLHPALDKLFQPVLSLFILFQLGLDLLKLDTGCSMLALATMLEPSSTL
jgi:hypothetical protein